MEWKDEWISSCLWEDGLISQVKSLASEIQKHGSVPTGPTTYPSSTPEGTSSRSRLQSPGSSTGAGWGGEGEAGTEVALDWSLLTCPFSVCSPISVYTLWILTRHLPKIVCLFAEGLSICGPMALTLMWKVILKYPKPWPLTSPPPLSISWTCWLGEKKKHNLKFENYVLFGELSED